MSYWHFTCSDGATMIGEVGVLKPHWHPMVGASLIWLTNDPAPSRDAVGLTSDTLFCDRMEFRYRIIDDEAYLKIRRWLGSTEQSRTAPHHQADLHRYSEPSKWYVSTKQLLAEQALWIGEQ